MLPANGHGVKIFYTFSKFTNNQNHVLQLYGSTSQNLIRVKVIPIKYFKKHGIYLHFVIPYIGIFDTSGKHVGKLYTIWSDSKPNYNQGDIILMKLPREGDIDNTLL